MSDATQAATTASDTTLLGGDTAASTTAAVTAATTTAAADGKPTEGQATTTDGKDTTADGKAADGAKADGKGGDGKKDDKPAGAPEKYEDFKLPEGVQVDPAVMGEFTAVAKELNLSQEQAQRLVDMNAKLQQGTVEQLQATIEATAEKWGADAKVDKEFGGDKFDENLAVAKRALDQFGTPELKTLLVQSKLGNHPEVLRFFYRAGQAISQDGFVPGRQGASGDAASVMYPSMKH